MSETGERTETNEADVTGERPAVGEGTAAETAATGDAAAPVTDAAAAEPAAKVAPPAPRVAARQWVVMRSASMDLRVGHGTARDLPRAVRSTLGRPHACALLGEQGASPELMETLRMNLCDQGFDVRQATLPAAGCDLAALERTLAALAETKVTSDDLALVVGGTDTLSVASLACSLWRGGVTLAELPLDLPTALAAATTPRALDAAGNERALAHDGVVRFSGVDVDLFDLDPAGDELPLALALAAQTAVCESDKSFGQLWDRAADLAAGDADAWVEQLRDSVKSRGKVAAASSVATRASLELGETFAEALLATAVAPVSAATALADGIRFASRFAAGQELLDIDDMFTIDELLERLGVPTTPAAAAPDPAALVERVRDLRLERTGRLMLAVPRALGRVRLTAVDDELLAEHAAAWCATRPEE